MVDQIRFFAGAARVLEGRAAGEYMAGHTSCVRREPIGVVRAGHAVELPADDGGLEVRAGARRRQHRRAQAVRHDAGVDRCCWPRSRPSSCRPGVLNVVCGDRDTGRALVAHPHPADGVDHRLGPGRHGGRRRGRGRPQARPPRARRQGAGHRVRRRRHRGGGRGHRRRRLLQRRPGLHRGDPGARRAAASTTTSSPRSPSRPAGTTTGPPSDDGRRSTARSTTPTSSSGSAGFVDRLPDHAPVVAGGHRVGDARLLLRADRRRRPAPGRRDRPGRDLRPGHHRAAVHRRGRGGRAGPTACEYGLASSRVDPGPRPGDADGPAARLRLRLDQHPHPARRRDAARRLQALRATARTCRCTASRTTPGSST